MRFRAAVTTPPTRDQTVVPPGEPDDRPAGRRPGALDDLLAVLGVYVVLGLVGAVLWWAFYDPAMFTKGEGGGLGMGEVELAKRFNADAWYAVIAGVLGLLSGTALTWWRARDPLLSAGLVLVGSLLAAGVMSVVGGWLGPPDPQGVAASVEVGDRVASPLRVDAAACYLVWPVTALIGSLIVLWSPPADETV